MIARGDKLSAVVWFGFAHHDIGVGKLKLKKQLNTNVIVMVSGAEPWRGQNSARQLAPLITDL